MTPADLEMLFSELAGPSPGRLSARPLAFGNGRYRVARQGDGAPALLVLIDDVAEPPQGEQLLNLSYLPRTRLRVESPGGEVEDAVYSVLICRSPDTELRHYFFRVVAALLDELGVGPAVAAIDSGIRRLLDLFRALERPGRRSLQGLWAELLLISQSPNPKYAVLAWHADPEALYDFASGSDRLEVKSTLKTIRRHHFRLEQLAAPPGGELVVASLMLTRSDNGLTVSALVDRVSALLPDDTEHRSRLESVVAAGLGSDWRLMSSTGFDEAGALASLRFFAGPSIPSVAPETPVEVSEVRFQVDLSSLPASDLDLRGSRPLFQALLSTPTAERDA